MIPLGLSAGHGGLDHGCTHGEIYESVIVLDLAYRAAALLGWSSLVEPVLIRQDDRNLTHAECADIAKRASCQALVEIHINSSSDPSRHGGLLLHHAGDRTGRVLGVEIFTALGHDFRIFPSDFRHEGEIAFPGALALTKAYHEKDIPCALIEVCHLSHTGDRKWLTEPNTPDKIAFAIQTGSEAWARDQRGVCDG